MNGVDKKKLEQYINQVSFGIDDVKLFLDTHPDNKSALDYYNKLEKLKAQAIEVYNINYGPLTADQVMSTDKWTWVSDPWPWELEG